MLFSRHTLLTSRRRTFARNVEVSFRIFQVVASPKVIASCYPRLPTLAPIAQDFIANSLSAPLMCVFSCISFQMLPFPWQASSGMFLAKPKPKYFDHLSVL